MLTTWPHELRIPESGRNAGGEPKVLTETPSSSGGAAERNGDYCITYLSIDVASKHQSGINTINASREVLYRY